MIYTHIFYIHKLKYNFLYLLIYGKDDMYTYILYVLNIWTTVYIHLPTLYRSFVIPEFTIYLLNKILFNKYYKNMFCFFIQNVFFGVGGAVFSCVGDWTSAKQRGLLTITLTILVMNLINLIILEIGEWRYLTPESIKKIMSDKGMETLITYGKN